MTCVRTPHRPALIEWVYAASLRPTGKQHHLAFRSLSPCRAPQTSQEPGPGPDSEDEDGTVPVRVLLELSERFKAQRARVIEMEEQLEEQAYNHRGLEEQLEHALGDAEHWQNHAAEEAERFRRDREEHEAEMAQMQMARRTEVSRLRAEIRSLKDPDVCGCALHQISGFGGPPGVCSGESDCDGVAQQQLDNRLLLRFLRFLIRVILGPARVASSPGAFWCSLRGAHAPPMSPHACASTHRRSAHDPRSR